jgi:hypothetical protein
MKISDFDKQKNDIIQYMNDLYNKFYDAIYNSGNIKIFKDVNHFHPMIWSYMYSGNECYTFSKILSDICGHMIYDTYSKVKLKSNFCSGIIERLSSMTHDKCLDIEKLSSSKITIDPIMTYYNIDECKEEYMSLYQISKKDENKKNVKNSNSEYYKSPEIDTENDEDIRKLLNKIVYH